MTPLQVIAFDPGLSTGLCIVETQEDGNIQWFQGEYTFREIGDILYKWKEVGSIFPNGVFVCESFTINNQTARNSQAPWSLEVIGLIRYISMVTHAQLVFQQPSAAKNLIKDDVIKRSGHWIPGKGHAMDATRHAIYHLVTEKRMMRECLIPE